MALALQGSSVPSAFLLHGETAEDRLRREYEEAEDPEVCLAQASHCCAKGCDVRWHLSRQGLAELPDPQNPPGPYSLQLDLENDEGTGDAVMEQITVRGLYCWTCNAVGPAPPREFEGVWCLSRQPQAEELDEDGVAIEKLSRASSGFILDGPGSLQVGFEPTPSRNRPQPELNRLFRCSQFNNFCLDSEGESEDESAYVPSAAANSLPRSPKPLGGRLSGPTSQAVRLYPLSVPSLSSEPLAPYPSRACGL